MVNPACTDVGQLMTITLLFIQCPPVNDLLRSVGNEGIRQTMTTLALLTFQVRKNYHNCGETFKGENLHEFCDLTATHESFLHKILGIPHPLCNQFNIPRKFSPRSAPYLLIHDSFLLRKFPAMWYKV